MHLSGETLFPLVNLLLRQVCEGIYPVKPFNGHDKKSTCPFFKQKITGLATVNPALLQVIIVSVKLVGRLGRYKEFWHGMVLETATVTFFLSPKS